jgi:hypothetical protein
MSIKGVPDEHLIRQHWHGPGGVGAIRYQHVPSGISVERQFAGSVPVRTIDTELLRELAGLLRAKSVLSAEDESIEGPTAS